jgi:hypothetical protein
MTCVKWPKRKTKLSTRPYNALHIKQLSNTTPSATRNRSFSWQPLSSQPKRSITQMNLSKTETTHANRTSALHRPPPPMARIGAAAVGVGRKLSSSSEAAVGNAELVAPHSIPSRTLGNSCVTAGYEVRVQMSADECCRRSLLWKVWNSRCAANRGTNMYCRADFLL